MLQAGKGMARSSSFFFCSDSLQVEAEVHKTFQKETKSMVMQAAKARAETVVQLETCTRHRGLLRAELTRILMELADKLKHWHVKLCKKYQDSTHTLRTSKRRTDEQTRAVEKKLKDLKERLEHTQNSVAMLLKPYNAALDLGHGAFGKLPSGDDLVSWMFALVADCEEPMISPTISEAVGRLISRSPLEKMQEMLHAGHQKQRLDQLDFPIIQQQLQCKSATAATELTPFLRGAWRQPSFLLSGPDMPRLVDMLKEFREALVDRTSHVSVKLLLKSEPFLKSLSDFKSELREDSVAAEVALVLALVRFSAIVRIQRGCKLMAAILNLRSLQLRKHALNQVLDEPLKATSNGLEQQARAVEASFRTIRGGLGVLRGQAQSMAKDAELLLKQYSLEIEDIVHTVQRLMPKTHAQGQRKDVSSKDQSSPAQQDSVMHLPSLLAHSRTSDDVEGADAVISALKYQQLLLKLHLTTRKWLRLATTPNRPEGELLETETAVNALHRYLTRRMPSHLASSKSDEVDAPEQEGAEDVEADGTEGARSPMGHTRARASSVPGLNISSEGTLTSQTPLLIAHAKTEWSLPSRCQLVRSNSDILHNRPLQQKFVEELSWRFDEYMTMRSKSMKSWQWSSRSLGEHSENLGDDYEESLEEEEEESLQEDPVEVKEKRSKATFLNWSRSGNARKDVRAQKVIRGRVLAKDAHRQRRHSATPNSDAPRFYTDLMGRQVIISAEAQNQSGRSDSLSETSEPDPLRKAPEMFEEVKFTKRFGEASKAPLALMIGQSGRSPVSVSKTPKARAAPDSRPSLPSSAHQELLPEAFQLQGIGVVSSPRPERGSSLRRQCNQRALKGAGSAGDRDDRDPDSEGSRSQSRSGSQESDPSFLMVDDDEVPLPGAGTPEPSFEENHRSIRLLGEEMPDGLRQLPPSPNTQAGRSPSPVPDSEEVSPRSVQTNRSSLWQLDDLELGRQSLGRLLAEKTPQKGRAFPSASANYTCDGPPGTARRLRLHERPASSRTRVLMAQPQIDEPCIEQPPEWGCPLPHEPGSSWKRLGAIPQATSDILQRNSPEAATRVTRVCKTSSDSTPVARDVETGKLSSEVNAQDQSSNAQVVPLSSVLFEGPTVPRATIRGRRCSGPARMWSSSGSKGDLQPSRAMMSPQTSQEDSDVETSGRGELDQLDEMLQEPDISVEREVFEEEVDEREDRVGAVGRVVHEGPERRGLPMTRRGVAHLLTQHEVVAPDNLELVGESAGTTRTFFTTKRRTAVEVTVPNLQKALPLLKPKGPPQKEHSFTVQREEEPKEHGDHVPQPLNVLLQNLLDVPKHRPVSAVTLDNETMERLNLEEFMIEPSRTPTDAELPAMEAELGVSDAQGSAEKPRRDSHLGQELIAALQTNETNWPVEAELAEQQAEEAEPKQKSEETQITGRPPTAPSRARPPAWEGKASWMPCRLSSLVGTAGTSATQSNAAEALHPSWQLRPSSAKGQLPLRRRLAQHPQDAGM